MLGLGREFDRKLLLETVGLPRSTFYYHAGRESADRYADVRPSIREIYGRTRNGMGYRQVRNVLRKEQGLRISRKTVRKLMREEGLLCRIRRPHYNSYKGETGRVAGNLLNRDFAADGPFEKLVTDVTEFVLPGCKAYLSPVMDLYNNEIVSWSVSKSQHMKTIDEMMDGLYEKLPEGAGSLLHSDQGWQYQQKSYQRRLAEHGIAQSMSRKATCLDNACMEGFFGHMKDEFYRGQRFSCFEAFKDELDDYIVYWNTRRRQERLNGLTPEEFRCRPVRAA